MRGRARKFWGRGRVRTKRPIWAEWKKLGEPLTVAAEGSCELQHQALA